MIIWLKYQEGGTTHAERFDALRARSLDETTGIAGVTLNQRAFAHRLGARLIYDVALGADELCSAAKKAWFVAFWTTGERWWISYDTGSTEPAAGLFTECTIPFGRIPWTYVGNNTNLPSAAFEMTAVEPT